MEVEVKIRLPTKEEYDKVCKIFGKAKKIENQKNYYLDDNSRSLKKIRNIVRLRVINDNNFLLTWKGKATLDDGISKVREEEVKLAEADGKAILTNPNSLLDFSDKYDLVKYIATIVGSNTSEWNVVGQFETKRIKFDWRIAGEDLIVELDETTYPFGTGWEIEVETTQPEKVKINIEEVLKNHKISYTDSKRNKYLNLINGSII